MNRYLRKLICLTVICALIFLCACDANTKMPEKSEMEAHFCEKYDDFQTILHFVLTEPSNVHIDYSLKSFDIWYGTEVSDEMKETIKSLAITDRIFIEKFGNTIQFAVWSPFARDISCGLAYSINGEDKPEVTYAIEMSPISEAGWYYYVDDFDTWCDQQTTESSERKADWGPVRVPFQ